MGVFFFTHKLLLCVFFRGGGFNFGFFLWTQLFFCFTAALSQKFLLLFGPGDRRGLHRDAVRDLFFLASR